MYENSGDFRDKIIELTKNEFIQSMLEHLSIVKKSNKKKNTRATNIVDDSIIVDNSILTNSEEDRFFYFENRIKTETKNLTSKIKISIEVAFEKDLLKKWVEGKIDLSVPKTKIKGSKPKKVAVKRKRMPRVSISVRELYIVI